ncbi:unnamed protein product [Cuscuta europaea]|uniref:Uncharacterized protein n=1 Tax=Cuscuta europaea TaxID=41803 RepID=A0A9P1EIH9_CUSEU|nr:unnamed protein product [Cuscuta europaea]
MEVCIDSLQGKSLLESDGSVLAEWWRWWQTSWMVAEVPMVEASTPNMRIRHTCATKGRGNLRRKGKGKHAQQRPGDISCKNLYH